MGGGVLGLVGGTVVAMAVEVQEVWRVAPRVGMVVVRVAEVGVAVAKVVVVMVVVFRARHRS